MDQAFHYIQENGYGSGHGSPATRTTNSNSRTTAGSASFHSHAYADIAAHARATSILRRTVPIAVSFALIFTSILLYLQSPTVPAANDATVRHVHARCDDRHSDEHGQLAVDVVNYSNPTST
jgi:hypothetical protein